MFYEALDKKRLRLLPALAAFKDRFYLAGGTGLALQIGHRISEDFDFFTNETFNNDRLLVEIKSLISADKFSITQDEQDTLTVIIDDEVKLSFFKLTVATLLPLIEIKEFKLASIEEIGIMKLLALPRATLKDYVDIYFILQDYELGSLILLAKKKHPDFEDSIYLKSLLSYNDVDLSPVIYLPQKEIKPKIVFEFIHKKTLEYIEKQVH